MAKLQYKITLLPRSPGVYLFKNKNAKVIYVGKAKNLRARAGQYFGQDSRPQVPYIVKEAVDIDFVVASSELEALFLENTLIKQYSPPYNIKLRDDKNYAFIKIDYSTEIPNIGYARKIEKNNNGKYFGPYSSTFKIKKSLEFIRRVFPYCANTTIGKRPCFYYFLHRCPGVCVGIVSIPEYKKHLARIQLFLSGKTCEVKKDLKTAMKQASQKQQYERAGKIRDQLKSMDTLEEHQVAQFAKQVDWDFISAYAEGGSVCVNLFQVREGKLIDKQNFIYTSSQTTDETIEVFMENYYAETSSLPKEIFTEQLPRNVELLSKLLTNRGKRVIPISVPYKGKKLELINLGKINAREFLHKWEMGSAENIYKIKTALEELKKILNLPTFPHRIEGYDISNTQGTNPVGSMVVTKDGLAAKGEYKKFKINVKNTPDDFAMMREILSRRLDRTKDRPDKPAWPIPDLLVIDGGKGQLGVTMEELKKRKLQIPVVGLAKRIEEIFVPNKNKPIILPHDSPTLHILQRLRDEAHRFAITFHKQLRSTQAVRSELDFIKGIGTKTKKLLKQKFGSVANIRAASTQELSATVGKQKADIIKIKMAAGE